MSELGTAYAACYAALFAATTAVWAGRAYADQAPVTVVRPYVTYAFAAGGDTSAIIRPDPNLLILIKCVADTLALAFQGDEQVRNLLDDHGELERIRNVGGDGEYILQTISREMRIHYVENVQGGAAQIYHSGARYRFILGRR